MPKSALAIEGFTKESELEFLAAVAATMAAGVVVVEVGSWKGRSTVAIAAGLAGIPGVQLVTVDTFMGDPVWGEQPDPSTVRQEFDENTSYIPFLKVIQAPSVQAAAQLPDGSVEWVFIDALHDYRSVRTDIAAWAPKVRTGGLISGHDYGRAGVTDAVESVFRDVQISGSVWMTRDRPRLRPLRVLRRAVR